MANCPEALEVVEVLKEGSALAQSESVGCEASLEPWRPRLAAAPSPSPWSEASIPSVWPCEVARCPGETCTIYTLSGEGLQKIHPRLLELLGHVLRPFLGPEGLAGAYGGGWSSRIMAKKACRTRHGVRGVFQQIRRSRW